MQLFVSPPPVTVEVTALVVYHNDVLFSVIAIDGGNSDVQIGYPRHLMTFVEFAEAVTILYSGHDEVIGRKLRQFLEGETSTLHLDSIANQMPSIGRVRVEVQTKMLVWPEGV